MTSTISTLDAAVLALLTWLLYNISQTLLARARSTKLRGPVASSWFFGVSRETFEGDSGALFEGWAESFGAAYQIPTTLGSRITVLCDPKAIAHFYSLETYGYVQTKFAKIAISQIIGKGLLWAEGDSHRRQRKALTPAFSNAAIRDLTPTFYDSAYKVKTTWDSIIQSGSSEEAIIDVQNWMNHVSLDSIGIAGFSHDFGSLEGKHSAVAEVFDSFGTIKPSRISSILPLLAPVLPFLLMLPTQRTRTVGKLHHSMGEIAEVLLRRSRDENAVGNSGKSSAGQSIIGALIKAEGADTELSMSEDEVRSQMKVLILAGYETTSISLTWALIELSMHQEKQEKLREELAPFAAKDPTYDQLTNGLPYLDAVMREVLRLHPPLPVTTRIAAADDVIPLSEPVVAANGQTIDSIAVAKGSVVTVPIRSMNRSSHFWGADAKDFNPERWIRQDGIDSRAREIQGYHHLLTFVDGPRMCLGRGFAIAEFKSVLSVLIRNYRFELRDGPATKIDKVRSILPRPKVAGEEGARVPLRVTRVE